MIEKDYIVMDNTTYELSAKIYDDCYNEGNFIGTFIMKRIEFEYDDDIDFKNKEFKFYKSFKEGNSWNTIDYGTFIVTDIEQSDTKETVKVTAYDYGLKFAQPYETELNYDSGTITLKNVFSEILTKVGVSTDITTFTNDTFIVDSNQFVEGQTYGTVMAQIAGISGNFAHIYNDKLCLIFTNQTNTVIEKGDYADFEDKRDTHPITIVAIEDAVIEGENVVKRWEEGILLYGENYLTIKGNLFAYTQEKRQELIDALFDKLKGFSYSAMKLTDCLFPSLKCGDLVQIRAKDNTLTNSIVLRWQNVDYVHTLEAPSIIKATIEYETPESALNIAKKTEIVVNKQEGTIMGLSSEIDENGDIIQEVQATLNQQQAQIQVIGTNIDEDGNITAQNVIVKEGFTFNENGLNIYTDLNSFNTLINNEGSYYKDGDEIVAEATKEGFMGKEFKERGQHSFGWDGSNYLFTNELIEVDGEYSYATFYNGND